MELKKDSIRVLKVKSKAETQVTFDEDYNVPDVKPDIGRMIQSKGTMSLDEVRPGDGRVNLKGSLQADLLYVTESGEICSLRAGLPVDEGINIEGISDGDKMCLKWEIEDLSLHVIHSRKLNIKAMVTFCVSVDEASEISIPSAVTDEEIPVQKKKVRLMSLCVHKKDTLRIKDEITLASNRPNIAELLWDTMEVRGLDLRPEDEMVKAKGELSVFALYRGDDEGEPIQWLEYTLPFGGEVECPGCTQELIPNIEFSVMHQSLEVKPDADGEERILQADVVLEFDMKLYREEEHELLLDVYSPVKECVIHGKKEQLYSLLVRNFSRCRLTDRVEVRQTQGRILQVCHSQGRVKIDKTKIVENGVAAEGVVLMKILYITGSDAMPFYSMDAVVPFFHVAEARGITQDCEYYIQAGLEQLSISMADSNELEVKASVGLNVLAMCRSEEMIIDQVEEQPLDMKKIREMPGITVYMVKQGDTLWSIARRFYTTEEEIRSLNELGEGEPESGMPLLLVKKVEG